LVGFENVVLFVAFGRPGQPGRVILGRACLGAAATFGAALSLSQFPVELHYAASGRSHD